MASGHEGGSRALRDRGCGRLSTGTGLPSVKVGASELRLRPAAGRRWEPPGPLCLRQDAHGRRARPWDRRADASSSYGRGHFPPRARTLSADGQRRKPGSDSRRAPHPQRRGAGGRVAGSGDERSGSGSGKKHTSRLWRWESVLRPFTQTGLLRQLF